MTDFLSAVTGQRFGIGRPDAQVTKVDPMVALNYE